MSCQLSRMITDGPHSKADDAEDIYNYWLAPFFQETPLQNGHSYQCSIFHLVLSNNYTAESISEFFPIKFPSFSELNKKKMEYELGWTVEKSIL